MVFSIDFMQSLTYTLILYHTILTVECFHAKITICLLLFLPKAIASIHISVIVSVALEFGTAGQ
jgi:hypothetical protein